MTVNLIARHSRQALVLFVGIEGAPRNEQECFESSGLDHADTLLAKHGYRRISEWAEERLDDGIHTATVVKLERVEVGAAGCGCPVTEMVQVCNGASVDGTERVEHRTGCWNSADGQTSVADEAAGMAPQRATVPGEGDLWMHDCGAIATGSQPRGYDCYGCRSMQDWRALYTLASQ